MNASSVTWLKDKRNRRLPIQSWIPKEPRFQLTLVHGLAEHRGCYLKWFSQLNALGIAVHSLDLPGHGLAEGVRGHIYSLQDYIDCLEQLRTENPHFIESLPSFVFGHSMGGLIASHYMQQNPGNFLGMILCSPLCGFDCLHGAVARLVAKYLMRKDPSMPVPKPPGFDALSRDPAMRQVYLTDPLRVLVLSPAHYLQMLDWSAEIQRVAPDIQTPSLVFMADKDKVVSPRAIQTFYQKLGSPDKSLVVFTYAFHEIIQEREKEELTPILLNWVEQHSPPQKL